MSIKVGIGQDSHVLRNDIQNRPLMLGGIEIPSDLSLMGNSDADVVLHALCNAISGISGIPILGARTDELCKIKNISDSAVYVEEAFRTLENYRITHVSVSLECLKPKMAPYIDKMRERIAEILNIRIEDVGITATSGEGLTSFGRGEGIQAFVAVTAEKEPGKPDAD